MLCCQGRRQIKQEVWIYNKRNPNHQARTLKTKKEADWSKSNAVFIKRKRCLARERLVQETKGIKMSIFINWIGILGFGKRESVLSKKWSAIPRENLTTSRAMKWLARREPHNQEKRRNHQARTLKTKKEADRTKSVATLVKRKPILVRTKAPHQELPRRTMNQSTAPRATPPHHIQHKKETGHSPVSFCVESALLKHLAGLWCWHLYGLCGGYICLSHGLGILCR